MKPLLSIAVLLSVFMTAIAPRVTAQEPAAIVKALDLWLKTYQKNKIDLGSRDDVRRDSIGMKLDALPKGMVGRLTARRELEELLNQAALHESKETLLAVLAIAAIGADDYRYDFRGMPHVARALGQAALERFASDGSRTELRTIARDGLRVPKGAGEAMQAAALRALAAFGDAQVDRALMESALGHADADVRAGAADALGRLGSPDALPALARAIDQESEGRAMEALGRAGVVILPHAAGARGQEAIAIAAAKALARTSWRADEALIDLLTTARQAVAIPALIAVLERFQTDQKKVKSGELSGVLRLRAHEALTDLTGAFFAAEDPAKWRAWWTETSATFQIAERKKDTPKGEGRTEAGFFGIPVHGTRVIFVVDLSLSMEARMPPLGTATEDKSKWPTRLDVAREQVWDAAQKLTEDAVFDVIVFSQGARSWQGKLVAANDANRKKLRKFLDELKPEPYTNLWEGLKAAMEFQAGSDAANNQFELDELFLLSDGAPTAGEIVDPPEILRVVTEANRYKRVRIHTVFLQGEGSEMDPKTAAGQMGPAELMESIAAQNDGVFVKR